MIYSSSDGKKLYVNLEQSGLAIIDITNNTNPFIISESYINFDIKSMVYYENLFGNPYIIGTFYDDGMIQILDLQNSSNPSIIGQCYIGKQTAGIDLLINENFIVVQSLNRLTIVEIRDLTNPVIVDEYQSNSIGFTYQMGLIETAIFMPTFEIFSIYSGNTFYFPYPTLETDGLGQKIFKIQLFAVDPITLDKTQEKVNLLSIETDDDDEWPYWTTMNYKTNVLSLTPPTNESLTIMRRLQIIFTTQILNDEFQQISPDNNSQTIINELLFLNYIDSNDVLTSEYDPTIPINFQNESFNETVQNAISNLLSTHYITHYITFTYDDFIGLDNAPVCGKLTLQAQWDNYGMPKIDSPIDFQFNPNTFSDPDSDVLTFVVSGLPLFLQFSGSNLRFYGTPSKNDLGIYPITIIASDGYKNVSETFVLTIQNQPPTCLPPGNVEMILGDDLDWQLPSNTFYDSNGDPLIYSLTMINETTKEELNAPNWLNLDTSRLIIYGTPGQMDVQIDEANNRFYQVFPLRLRATDIADQSTIVDFNLTVQNYFPIYNSNLTLSNQLSTLYGSYIKVNKYFNFEFSSFTFKDPENVALSFTVSSLPDWLLFIDQRFYGTPSKNDLGNYTINVTASDGFSNVTGIFMISVENHPPIAGPLSNFNVVFGNSLNLSIPTSDFVDPEDDPLTFQAFVIENNELNTLPSWIIFDNEKITFAGMPTEDFIPYIPSEQRYYKLYEISIFAYDICNANVSSNFNLTVEKTPPIKNPSNSLASQFLLFNPTVNTIIVGAFSDNTFIDEDNDVLTYESRLVSDSGNDFSIFRRLADSDGTMILPDWIQFDPESRQFSISPLPKHFGHTYVIEVIASNSKLETSDTFSFKVGMSVEFAFTIILGILGAVGSFLGIYAYRKLIYSIFGKRFYCYSVYDRITVNQNYKKNIYLIQEDLEICQRIWNIMLKIQKDLPKIYDSPQKDQLMNELIKKATAEFKIQSHLEDLTQLDHGRFREIFESYLIFATIKKHPQANQLFNQIKKSLQKDKLKSWYFELINFSNSELNDEKCNSFAKIEINLPKLRSVINGFNKTNKKTNVYDNIPEIEKNLINEKLKAYALGIPAPFSKSDRFMEDSRGESLWINRSDIAEIQIVKLQFNNKNLDVHPSLFDFPRHYSYNCLTSWLHYKVERDVLVFYGQPSYVDIGKYVVRIFNRHLYVVREFGLNVEDEKDPKITESEANLNTEYSSKLFSPSHTYRTETSIFLRKESIIKKSEFGKEKKKDLEIAMEKIQPKEIIESEINDLKKNDDE